MNPELLLVSDLSGGNIVYDPFNGNALSAYKGKIGSQKRTLCLVGQDFLLSSGCKSLLLNLWAINKAEQCGGGIKVFFHFQS